VKPKLFYAIKTLMSKAILIKTRPSGKPSITDFENVDAALENIYNMNAL